MPSPFTLRKSCCCNDIYGAYAADIAQSQGGFMSVNFGTSGLRARAVDFTASVCRAYLGAFLNVNCGGVADKTVYLGADLRASSPDITGYCVAAVVAEGWRPVYAGNVPTPALAVYALKRGAPAIMITGSHIPENYNGIKFYRPDGEFLKSDEAPVRAAAEARLARNETTASTALPAIEATVAADYIARYTDAFPGKPLAGLKVGVDLHSAVGRDLTVAILEGLGADVVPFRRADHFIAVDTEALDLDDVVRAKAMLAEHGLAAVVSTDGDGDRPLVIDETGSQINGDVLGALTARYLGITTLVTPLTSTTGIEQSGWFECVVRTRIGSPYVVEAMAAETAAGRGAVAGFEANGGFLVESDLKLGGRTLTRLPTRDAILPIVGTLLAARAAGITLSALAATLPARVMKANRLKEIAPNVSQAFLKRMAGSREARVALDPVLADPTDANTVDGLRFTFADRSVVHFRASGNAPELRAYVETATAAETDALLARVIAAMEKDLRR
jgi:phosphomannomutase